MSYLPSNLTASATAFCVLANTAYADLNPAEVWDDARANLEIMGYTVTATEELLDGTLTVSDITLNSEANANQQAVTISMGPLQFSQVNGGDVEVILPATMPVTIDMAATALKRPARIEMSLTQSGQEILVSGDPDAMVFDYTADSFGLSLDTLTIDDTLYEADSARFLVSGENVQSQRKVIAGETRSYDQSMQIDRVTYDVFFNDPAQVEALQMTSTLENISFGGISSMPDGESTQSGDFSALLTDGFMFEGEFKTGTTETQTEITSTDGTSKIKTGTEGTTLAIAMGQDGIRYDAQARQLQIGAQLAGLPFPLFAQMQRSGMSLSSPVQKSDEPQDFAMSFDMTDFTMSDIIWALFDPSGQLPRDPATVAVDLSGKAKVLFDLFDPTSVEALTASGATPGELSALTLNRLELDAVGAKINARGDLTFDNTDKTTLPGFPKPVGAIDIDIAGANGLMDKLVAIGLLPAQQVTGARLMLGLFAVPGATPDTLSSKIEFNEAGQILANGQRIK
ncbi:DUF2125 domain-containing protein [Sulfitobacter sp.]|uniref:DUF2125 domain-containing protein n=1 Tax=Sulfitobacter sp. TaxID=1903071 RepID=UPI0032981BA6